MLYQPPPKMQSQGSHTRFGTVIRAAEGFSWGGMQRQVPCLPQPDMQMLEVLPSFAPALAIPLTHRQLSLYPGHSYTF